MAMANSVYELDVFKRAYRVSLDLHKITLGFPKIEQFAMGDQIRRTSKSIYANLAEGLGRNTTAIEQKSYISMALGSCEEMRVWLRYVIDLELIDETRWAEWQKEYKEIAMMLNGLAKTR